MWRARVRDARTPCVHTYRGGAPLTYRREREREKGARFLFPSPPLPSTPLRRLPRLFSRGAHEERRAREIPRRVPRESENCREAAGRYLAVSRRNTHLARSFSRGEEFTAEREEIPRTGGGGTFRAAVPRGTIERPSCARREVLSRRLPAIGRRHKTDT